jgi:hypothetical protein
MGDFGMENYCVSSTTNLDSLNIQPQNQMTRNATAYANLDNVSNDSLELKQIPSNSSTSTIDSITGKLKKSMSWPQFKTPKQKAIEAQKRKPPVLPNHQSFKDSFINGLKTDAKKQEIVLNNAGQKAVLLGSNTIDSAQEGFLDALETVKQSAAELNSTEYANSNEFQDAFKREVGDNLLPKLSQHKTAVAESLSEQGQSLIEIGQDTKELLEQSSILKEAHLIKQPAEKMLKHNIKPAIHSTKQQAMNGLKHAQEVVEPQAKTLADTVCQTKLKISDGIHSGEVVTPNQMFDIAKKDISPDLRGLQEVFQSLLSGDWDLEKAKIAAAYSANSNSVLLKKLCQIGASKEDLHPDIRDILRKTQSSNEPSHSLEEMREIAEKLFPGKYTIPDQKPKAASVGDVVFGSNAQGEEVAIKVVKKDVTEQAIRDEQKIGEAAIRLAFKDPHVQEYHLANWRGFANGVLKEPQLNIEAENAAAIQKGAIRYNICQALDLGTLPNMEYPTVMVQQKAKGLPLEKVMAMLRTYNAPETGPAEYAEQYQKEIAEYPWLKNPNEWMHELSKSYMGVTSEQAYLRLPKNGETVALHGDLHPGNIFYNAKWNELERRWMLEPTLIDSGMAIIRDQASVIRHLGLMVHPFIGNTKTLARMVIEGAQNAPSNPVEKQALIQQLQHDLDQSLFKAQVWDKEKRKIRTGSNITDAGHNSKLMDRLMEKYHLIPAENDTLFFKGKAQEALVFHELRTITGQPRQSALKAAMPDAVRGVKKLYTAAPRQMTKQIIGPMGAHIAFNPEHALVSALQFAVKVH